MIHYNGRHVLNPQELGIIGTTLKVWPSINDGIFPDCTHLFSQCRTHVFLWSITSSFLWPGWPAIVAGRLSERGSDIFLGHDHGSPSSAPLLLAASDRLLPAPLGNICVLLMACWTAFMGFRFVRSHRRPLLPSPAHFTCSCRVKLFYQRTQNFQMPRKPRVRRMERGTEEPQWTFFPWTNALFWPD